MFSRPLVKEAFIAQSIADCLEGLKSIWSTETITGDPEPEETQITGIQEQAQQEDDNLDTLPVREEYWDASNPALNLHVEMDSEFIKDWAKDRESDQAFSSIYKDEKRELENWKQDGRFVKDQRGLLFF